MPHVNATTWAGISADIAAGAAHARTLGPDRPASLFTIGFCFGGRMAFLSATLGLGSGRGDRLLRLAGRAGTRRIARASRRRGPDRRRRSSDLFGGADAGIPPEAIAAFDDALERAGVEHRLVTYPNAPAQLLRPQGRRVRQESEQAWAEILAFVGAHPSADMT